MASVLSHLRVADYRLLGLVGLSLVLVVLYLGGGWARLEESASGWRRIDTLAVQQRIDSGELSGREADWYRPSGTAERTDPRGGR